MPQLTLQQAFDLALQYHRAGRLREAEQVYRQILTHQPEHAAAIHYLGMIAHQTGRNDTAIDLIRRAIALRPDYAEAHSNLGNALKGSGQLNEAIAVYRQAIALKPNLPEVHSNLGDALKEQGRLDEAIAACRQAIALRPDFPEAHNNLGNALMAKGQLTDAIAACRQAVILNPNLPQAHGNLGNALAENGQLDDAVAEYRRSIALNPNSHTTHKNLGDALAAKGQLDEAIAAFRQAISLSPNYAEAHNCLGLALKDLGYLDDSIAAYQRAIVLNPNLAEAHSNLGNELRDQGQLDEAIAACQKAVDLSPNSPEAYNNLGSCLAAKGQLDEAIAAYRQAIALKPGNVKAHSNLVLTLHYHVDYDAKAIGDEHLHWNRLHCEPLRKFILPHPNDRSPDRRLRIGYVSPDFREHPAGRFLLPLLTHHDKNAVEVFAYAQVPTPDATTQRLRSCTDGWRNLLGLSDEQAADLIRQDKIDVLVDLAMHSAGSRLLVFARKPAPIQVTYLAYCSSTGLDTIDYRLSDPYLDPPGEESFYSEQTIRLPNTYWCYQAPAPSPAVGPLPVLGRGRITFGCLSNFSKINEQTLGIWAELLRATPDSQLLLSAHEGSHRQQVQEHFEREGIKSSRVRFSKRVSYLEYFALYHGIDIALDTFPFAGGTTTCDSLWMGVPVVSLVGKTAVGRGGLSILSNIGMPELVARSEKEYLRIAGDLARDLPRLGQLRSTLRQRMEQSPLMNAPKFARNIEAAYRQMWHAWRLKPVASI